MLDQNRSLVLRAIRALEAATARSDPAIDTRGDVQLEDLQRWHRRVLPGIAEVDRSRPAKNLNLRTAGGVDVEGTVDDREGGISKVEHQQSVVILGDLDLFADEWTTAHGAHFLGDAGKRDDSFGRT